MTLWHSRHFSTGGMPALEEREALEWQKKQLISFVVACIRWLNGIGCAGPGSNLSAYIVAARITANAISVNIETNCVSRFKAQSPV